VRKHWICSVVMAAFVGFGPGLAFAGDDDAGLEGLKTPPRSERLDIFGAGMCHQCEWRPHAKMMAAQEQCGVAPDGKARVGVFECGRSPQCDTVCHFISCEGQ
jgi:hypothetical protein